MVDQRCSTCAWFGREDWYQGDGPDENGDYGLGFCEWPADRLPWSLRYGNRERMGVYANQGETCSCWEPVKPAANPDQSDNHGERRSPTRSD